MPLTLSERCARLIGELGLGRSDEVSGVRPLTGGVASDIAVVSLPGREVAVKFALEKLKVAEEWRAPVRRNGAEYAWLSFARGTCPENAPALYGRSAGLQGFAMEYLQGDDVYLWKQALLESRLPQGEAEKVGRLLGRLHAASAVPGFDRTPFENRDDFRALRLEPYLSFTAGRHPQAAERLNGLADALYRAADVLVHGDVSPKNILMRGRINGGEPVLLDAECASMGDASFDLAFCLNHLVLKAVHLPARRQELLGDVTRFWDAYAPHVTWEDPAELGARVAALVPALMLARVDGKSPVEYLGEEERGQVRGLSLTLLEGPAAGLPELVQLLGEGIAS